MSKQMAAALAAAVAALLFLAPLAERPLGAQAYLKINAGTTLLGVPGVGVEFDRGRNNSLQLDAIVSPWISRDGAPAAFAIFLSEWRHHPHGVANGIYFGAHAGLTVFRFQKWTFVERPWYQEGFGALLGGTVGYEKRLGQRWLLDAHLGGGTSQAFYKGYNYETGERNDGAKHWNRSGELLPYRVGLTVAYALRGRD